MRCPTCLFEGKTHSVVANNAPAPSQQLAVAESWDEANHHHVHDSTIKFGFFSCSNGHDWNVTHTSRCPADSCDWNWRPEIRGQVHVQIPGRPETYAEFRSRKLSQFARMKEQIPRLWLDNLPKAFWCYFGAGVGGVGHIVFGEIRIVKPGVVEITDLSDAEIATYFNGGQDHGST